MAEEKTKPIEKEYTIPLRERCRVVPRYKKTNKAVKTVKEFLARHMKVYDRDLNKIKLNKYLNEFLWERGIKNPKSKVKVKAIQEGDLVRVELAELPYKFLKKKAREEKAEKKANEKINEKKPEEKKEEEKPSKEDIKKTEEEKEKKASTIEASKEMEKAAAKKMKHETKGSHKEKTTPRRQSLKK